MVHSHSQSTLSTSVKQKSQAQSVIDAFSYEKQNKSTIKCKPVPLTKNSQNRRSGPPKHVPGVGREVGAHRLLLHVLLRLGQVEEPQAPLQEVRQDVLLELLRGQTGAEQIW